MMICNDQVVRQLAAQGALSGGERRELPEAMPPALAENELPGGQGGTSGNVSKSAIHQPKPTEESKVFPHPYLGGDEIPAGVFR